MGRDKTERTDTDASKFDGLAFRRAGLLDVPFVFDLMLEGSVAGSFSDQFLAVKTGARKLLWMLLRDIALKSWRTPRTPLAGWFVARHGQQPIGFVHVYSTSESSAGSAIELALCAVSPALRNQGYGTAVIRALIARYPPGTTLTVHCTKYARAMQHILKRLGFLRNPRAGFPVEQYRYVIRTETRLAVGTPSEKADRVPLKPWPCVGLRPRVPRSGENARPRPRP